MLPTLAPVRHPRYKFRITYSDPTRRTAKGRARTFARYFNDEGEARRVLAEMGGIVAERGVSGLLIDSTLRTDALDARAKLDAAGFVSTSLAACVDRFLAGHTAGPAERREVHPLLERFLDFKVHEEGASIATRENLAQRVGAWINWQRIVVLGDITAEKCLMLRSRVDESGKLLAEQTRRNDMNAVSSFLSWLVTEAKALAYNPLMGQRRPKVRRQRPEIYPPADCQRILDAVAGYQGGKFARAVGLLFLAGLRPSELPAALIRTDGPRPLVRVEGGKMRGRANRIVELSAAGAAWLDARPAKIIAPSTGQRRQICKLAGGVEWIQDGARHTWISAKCELLADDAVVARMAGTSKDIIFAHYHALMPSSDAKAIEQLGARPRKKIAKGQR